jgi:hypothetical protein
VVAVPPLLSGGLPQAFSTTAPVAEMAAVAKNFRLETLDIEFPYLLIDVLLNCPKNPRLNFLSSPCYRNLAMEYLNLIELTK